jgi:hypothetical protein
LSVQTVAIVLDAFGEWQIDVQAIGMANEGAGFEAKFKICAWWCFFTVFCAKIKITG